MKLRLFFIVLLIFSSSCSSILDYKKTKIDLEQIKRKGKLTVLIENNSLSFYEQKGEKLGFEYEILKAFAQSIHLPLEIKVISNSNDLFRLLHNEEGDIAAANLAISFSNSKTIDYSLPYYFSEQVLIQRDGNNRVKSPLELGKKNIYVQKNSCFEKRLIALEEEIGTKINIRTFEDDPITEDLIQKVANKEINFTLAHENLARLSSTSKSNLNIDVKISMEQKIAFALRSSSPELKKELNQFLSKYCKTEKFSELKKKYFDYIDIKPIVTNYWPKENLSPYDDLFKSAAKKYSWDWKMLAAISYQESRFNPDAVGPGGSFGLMQFMPRIGRAYGITPNSSPKEQIDAAIESLNKIYLSWSNIPNSEERIKFTLASYNAGKCHIQDAQKLSVKKGLNPLVWNNNVALMIKKLSDPKIYKSSDIRCGAYRGGAVAYVRIIYSKYQSWR